MGHYADHYSTVDDEEQENNKQRGSVQHMQHDKEVEDNDDTSDEVIQLINAEEIDEVSSDSDDESIVMNVQYISFRDEDNMKEKRVKKNQKIIKSKISMAAMD